MTPAQLASLTDESRAAIAAQLKALRSRQTALDPVAFATETLGLKPWSKQAEILRAVAAHDRVAVRSGHKVGKSTSAAILALWWINKHEDGRVVMTAPTGRQVRLVLWREVTRLYRRSVIPLGGFLSANPDPGLKYEDGREIVGFSTDESEKIAGVSGANVLYIVDEGSGVSEDIFEAIEGSRAGGAKLVVLGNPTKTSGTFYNSFVNPIGWKPLHISSEHSPNITGETSIPGLATASWVAEKLEEWGEQSPLFQVRVRGNFPTQAENSVIGLGLVEAARERYDDTPEAGALSIGVDVARFGDDQTVIWPVRGKKALTPVVLKGADTVFVAGKVLEVAQSLARAGERPTVRVDTVGVGGGVADVLRRFPAVHTVDINASESSYDDTYARCRDEMWFALKTWMADGAIPSHDRLHRDLVAPTYSFLPTGKIKVESKDEIKKRLDGRSTDYADALALAVYSRRPVAPIQRGVFKVHGSF